MKVAMAKMAKEKRRRSLAAKLYAVKKSSQLCGSKDQRLLISKTSAPCQPTVALVASGGGMAAA
jgi:hypothetical protein